MCICQFTFGGVRLCLFGCVLVGFYIPNVCVCFHAFVCMHRYLNRICSQQKLRVFVGVDGDLCICVCLCTRYGPTLTPGPPSLGFRAWNNLRLMFIYKHTPRRTRLRGLCTPSPLHPHHLSLPLSLSSSCLAMFLLSSSCSLLLCGSSVLSCSRFEFCSNQILPSIPLLSPAIFLLSLRCIYLSFPANECTDAHPLQYVEMIYDRTLSHCCFSNETLLITQCKTKVTHLLVHT